MKILVTTLTGKIMPIEVESLNTIATVKAKIHEQEGLPPLQQKLIKMGKNGDKNDQAVLEDDKTLLDYNIQDEEKIIVILKIR